MSDEQILGLIQQLDTIDREIARLDAAAQAARHELEEARAALGQRQQERDAAAAALEANRAEERAGMRRLEDLRRSREAALRILQSGAGNAEAAERQLERCDGLIDEAETAQLELMEAQDGLVAALEAADAALRGARERAEQLEAEVPGRVREAETARAEQLRARAPVVGQLPRDVADRYAGFRQRGRWAVARVRDKACEACARAVQPQMIADLQRGRLVTCHGCHRWLML